MKKSNPVAAFLFLFFLSTIPLKAQKIDILKKEKTINQSVNQDGNGITISPILMNMVDNLEAIDVSTYMVNNGEIALMAQCTSKVEALAEELNILGAKNVKTYKHVVTFRLDIQKIKELEKCTQLKYVAPEIRPVAMNGSVQSEAVKALKVNLVRERFNYTGKGVKIGVIANSYNILGGAEAGVKSGDLPGPNNPNGYVTSVSVLSEFQSDSNLSNDEGRAMIELIHDIAPDAEILFYSGANGFFDFADGIRELAMAGADIIVDDIFYFSSPFFQNGVVAQAVNEVSEQGVIYFSAAGNQGQASYESDFNPGPDGLLHDFDPGPLFDGFQTIEIPANTSSVIVLQWDQSSSQFSDHPQESDTNNRTDLEVVIIDPDTQKQNVVNQDPNTTNAQEIFNFNNTDDTPKLFEIAFRVNSGPVPQRIKWVNYRGLVGNIEHYDPSNSSTIVGHPNAEKAIAVGAVPFFLTKNFKNRKNSAVSNTSSLGGLLLRLNDDGTRKIVPLDTRKPNFMATEGANTTFFGTDIRDTLNLSGTSIIVEEDNNPNFFGTSAAAPNAAAIAALILQSNPNMSRENVQKTLSDTAEDMDSPLTEDFDKGYDRKTGFGLIDAAKAINRAYKRTGLERLTLEAECLDSSESELRWGVFNSNPVGVAYTILVNEEEQDYFKVAKPGKNYFTTDKNFDNNSVRIRWKVWKENKWRTDEEVIEFDFEKCGHLSATNLNIYPNPVQDYVTVSYTSDVTKNSLINFSPFNVLRTKPVMHIPVQVYKGKNEFKLDLSDLSRGLYIMEFEGVAKKLIKQ